MAKKPAKKKKAKAPLDPLSAFKATAEKRWGDSLVMASDIPRKHDSKQSTGNFALDVALFGGWARGRVNRAYGTERSTKTGSMLNTVAEFQKRCCYCFSVAACKCKNRRPAGVLWADLENKLADDLMIPWMKGHGIDMSAMLMERPESGDEVVDLFDMAIRQGIGLVVCDSIAHMTSQEEIEKPAEDGRTAPVSALLVNKAMRKWIVALSQRGFKNIDQTPTVLLINQIRGTLSKYTPEALPGGKGQTFATSLDVRFHSSKSKWRYRVVKADGSFSDLQKPEADKGRQQDVTPDYQEVDFRVTTSSCCPAGRYGTYRYWLKNAHGRRKGDPDNAATIWTYAKRYGLVTNVKGGYGIVIPEAWATEEEREIEPLCVAPRKDQGEDNVMRRFRQDADAQKRLWEVFVRELCKS